jgi:hypothetical protein
LHLPLFPVKTIFNILSICFVNYGQKNLGGMSHNVPAVLKPLARQSERFGGAIKKPVGFRAAQYAGKSRGKERYTVKDFTYEEKENSCQCPAGKQLSYKGYMKLNRNGGEKYQAGRGGIARIACYGGDAWQAAEGTAPGRCS